MQIVEEFSYFIDSHSVDKTQSSSMKLALGGTGIVWLIILIILAVSPVFKKPEHYKTVQIMLEPVQKIETTKSEKSSAAVKKVPDATAKEAAAPKKVQKTQEAPAAKKTEPVKQPQKAQEARPAAQKTAEPAKTAPSQAPAKAASKPAEAPKAAETPKPAEPYKKADIKYARSMDELLEEQMNKTSSSKKEIDWDSFDGVESSSSSASSSNNAAKSITGGEALSGSAGTATAKDKAVTATDGRENSKNYSSSAETSGTLNKIAETEQTFEGNVGDGGNGISSRSKVMAARSNDGKISLSLSDGSSRVLIEPKEPKIFISEENSKLIDNTRTVTIEFTVLPSGNVPQNGISFRPAAVIPPEIQSEIRTQISRWRFAPGPTEGVAIFEYSIIKR